MTLDALIREAMVQGGVQSLNLFRNDDNRFQANIGFRDSSGSYKIVRSADPVAAVTQAFKAAKKRIAANAKADFSDLV